MKTIFSIVILLFGFFCNAGVLAKIETNHKSPSIDDGWKLYFSGDIHQAESVARGLVGGVGDVDGSATILMAAILYKEKKYNEVLNLLNSHEALRGLYKEKINVVKVPNGKDGKKILYYRLKALVGKSRYQLGERDKSVLDDLIAGVSYSDHDLLIEKPDFQAMQFVALMSFMFKKYNQAIVYWERMYAGIIKLNIDKKHEKEVWNEFVHATEYNIACAYSKIGDVDNTLVWLKKSLLYKPNERINFIMTDHDLDNIRENPKFKRFIKKING